MFLPSSLTAAQLSLATSLIVPSCLKPSPSQRLTRLHRPLSPQPPPATGHLNPPFYQIYRLSHRTITSVQPLPYFGCPSFTLLSHYPIYPLSFFLFFSYISVLVTPPITRQSRKQGLYLE
ncbi:hypothetical protein EDB80DRAFT_135840 [Ilyonectria destructans]|nr:hypothetical protein EDB80DRAFT_135840 [Ilyonectria destructans]